MAITQEKAKKIAEEYAKKGFLNQEQALISCGYSPKYARTGISRKLFANLRVKAEIAKIQAKQHKKYEITIIQQIEDIKRLRDEAWESKHFSAVNAANDQLNKHLGIYEADNEQKREQDELTDAQVADIEEFKAWKRRQLLGQVRTA
ncbi:MAG: hypothetical protein JXA96_17295 [Sedimentisphaerales bacterium]|nr:hypothetical protein [Sedimentisphaerales bacterium]